MSEATDNPRIVIEPAPLEWARCVRGFTPSWDGWRESRVAAGVARDGRVIMTGHQAQIWHAGILAKYLAVDAAVAQHGGADAWHAAWLVVDQDDNEAETIAYPKRGERGANAPVRGVWRLGAESAAGVPTAERPVVRPTGAASLNAATEEATAGLRAVRDALTKHAGAGHTGEGSAAAQIAAALADLMRPVRGGAPDAATVFATRLHATPVFGALLDAMRADPARCTAAYNDAVRVTPKARMRPLSTADGRIELPLWRIVEGPRRPVFADELATIPREELAPRALLMTGLCRLALCDLFVHGLGGGVYDTITDAWFAAWMPGERLAPTAVVTADVFADFGAAAAGLPTPVEADHAVWLAHKARHDPAAVGDHHAAARKAAILERVDAAKAAGEDPLPHYRALHDLLEDVRAERAAALENLDTAAAELREGAEQSRVIFDRTWPFPLLGEARLGKLREAIRSRFAAEKPAAAGRPA